MKLETAKKLNVFVNNPLFQEAMGEYIKYHIDALHLGLEGVKTIDDLAHNQGRILELRRFDNLRKNVNAVLELARK